MLAEYVKRNLPLLNSIIAKTQSDTPMYLCPSYFDDDGVLVDCVCGRCK